MKFGRLSPDEYKKTKPATMFEKRAKDIISAGSKNLIPAVREMTDRVEGKSYIVVQNNMLIANFDDGERTRVQDTMNKLREIAELE